MASLKEGFKCGLEIHQQLDVNKLFCSCSSAFEEKNLKEETLRKLRAVAGEVGEVDRAAQFEFFRNREFIYHSYENEACLIELDEQPPNSINKEALRIALQTALILKMSIPPELYIMRKTVTDGSAVSGFQRTVLVALGNKNSVLKTSKGDVHIINLSLEEDASKIEKKEGNKVYYSLSRLGIPLLEIGTAAEIRDGEHAKEVALLIGNLLRAFKETKRGIGTIRQDVNVSIKGGARIEVKGWQELNTLPKLIENEVSRQRALIQIKEKLLKAHFKNVDEKAVDATKLFRNTNSILIKKLLHSNAAVLALKLKNFAGLFKTPLCLNKTFGKEIAEYAIPYGVDGIIHSDEDLSKYKLEPEFNLLRKELKASNDDLILIIAERKEIAEKAMHAIIERINYCIKGVPEETRVPNHENATTSYARPLPGADRMYPETDLLPIKVEVLEKLKKQLPELRENKAERFVKLGLNNELANSILHSSSIEIFEELAEKHKNEAREIAIILLNTIPDLQSREKINPKLITKEKISSMLEMYEKNEILKDSFYIILSEIGKGNNKSIEEIVKNKHLEIISDAEARAEIKKIIQKLGKSNINAVIVEAMKQLKGKIEGRKIVEIVKHEINK